MVIIQYFDFLDSDIVIEVVFEDIEIKYKVFVQLVNVVGEYVVFVINIFYFDVDVIVEWVVNLECVLGLYFFLFVYIMWLFEVVCGKKILVIVLVSVMQLGKCMCKVVVVLGVCYGFIGNCMLFCYGCEVGLMLLEGVFLCQIDKVLIDFGMFMGLFIMGDMVGLDIGYMNCQKLDLESFEQCVFFVYDRLVEMDCKGQKIGVGFYCYEKGDWILFDDEMFEDVLCVVWFEQGISLCEFDDSEIVDCCMFVLINEGVKIFDEGIVWCGSDIDVVYVNGYGFLWYCGGFMFYVDIIGLDMVLVGICVNVECFGDCWWIVLNLFICFVESGECLFVYEI